MCALVSRDVARLRRIHSFTLGRTGATSYRATMIEPSASSIAAAVVAYFTTKRRDLPWRRSADPYAIWVSEIMLQQTRVQTVVPYWERWMAKFPTVTALAAADPDDVLAAWAGLGYYSRARNLHAGAQAVAARWSGSLPRHARELQTVPGIGPYTAGAIASIAYGERTPVVDGNVARVLSRVYAIRDDIKSAAGQRALWTRAGELVAALDVNCAPGDLNQGLMELGATLCTPTGAESRCEPCPLRTQCLAARTGRRDQFPVVAKRKVASELPVLARAALWLAKGDQLVLARRTSEGLFGGLWELPGADDVQRIARAVGVTAVDPEPVAYHQQTLSHRRLRITVYRGAMPTRLVDRAIPGYDAIARVDLHTAHRLGVAAATTAILSTYKDNPWSSIPKRSLFLPKATTRSSKVLRDSVTTPTTTISAIPRHVRPKASTSSSTIKSRSNRKSKR